MYKKRLWTEVQVPIVTMAIWTSIPLQDSSYLSPFFYEELSERPDGKYANNLCSINRFALFYLILDIKKREHDEYSQLVRSCFLGLFFDGLFFLLHLLLALFALLPIFKIRKSCRKPQYKCGGNE
jgi:hypothetical protein